MSDTTHCENNLQKPFLTTKNHALVINISFARRTTKAHKAYPAAIDPLGLRS